MSIALIIIDVQNDFVEGGALAVPNGSAVVSKINTLRAGLNNPTVVLSQDCHPADHCSFITNNPGATVFTVADLEHGPQMMWPPHCVQGSPGAEFVSTLVQESTDTIIQKGTLRLVDSYSAFGDSSRSLETTPLLNYLRSKGIKTVICAGLALDYCVSYTARDAADAGFKTYVVLDSCRGIAEDSIDNEIQKMLAAGVDIRRSMTDLPTELLVPVPGRG